MDITRFETSPFFFGNLIKMQSEELLILEHDGGMDRVKRVFYRDVSTVACGEIANNKTIILAVVIAVLGGILAGGGYPALGTALLVASGLILAIAATCYKWVLIIQGWGWSLTIKPAYISKYRIEQFTAELRTRIAAIQGEPLQPTPNEPIAPSTPI